MQTIQDRGYVWKRGATLVPTWTAFAVVNLLERHFETLVDYAFTARMEDDLDAIARNEMPKAEWLGRFYFGDGDAGLKRSWRTTSARSTRPRSTRSPSGSTRTASRSS